MIVLYYLGVQTSTLSVCSVYGYWNWFGRICTSGLNLINQCGHDVQLKIQLIQLTLMPLNSPYPLFCLVVRFSLRCVFLLILHYFVKIPFEFHYFLFAAF